MSVLVSKKLLWIFVVFVFSSLAQGSLFNLPLEGSLEMTANLFNISLDNETTLEIGDGEVSGTVILLSNTSTSGNYTLVSLDAEARQIEGALSIGEFSSLIISTSTNISQCITHGDQELLCTFISTIEENGTELGDLSLSVNFQDISFGTFNISRDNESRGFIFIEGDDIEILDLGFDRDSKILYTNIRYNDGGILFGGDLVLQTSKGRTLYPIRKGRAGPIILTGTEENEFIFIVQGFRLFSGGLSDIPPELDLELPLPSYSGGYVDSDRDGVSDIMDACPSSSSKAVDSEGCSCSQKECPGSCRLTPMPTCIDTCYDGKKNQGESGVDCGGPCGECEDLSLVGRAVGVCDSSTCKDPFSCNSEGVCSLIVETEGKICKTDDVEYGMDISCVELGDDYYLEDHQALGSYKVTGFPIIKQIAKSKAKKMIDKYSICVRGESIGCVVPQSTCSSERVLEDDEKRVKAEALLVQKIDSEMEIPSIIDFFIDIDVSADLRPFSKVLPFTCEPIEIKEEESCKPYLENGDIEDKLDILIIGDGYSSMDSFFTSIHHVLSADSSDPAINSRVDFKGLELANQPTFAEKSINYTKESKEFFISTSKLKMNDVGYGFFSEEPFASNKDKINVWYIFDDILNYAEEDMGEGQKPSYKEIYAIANRCPWWDVVVVLSDDMRYRPDCLSHGGPCRNSMAEESTPGRLFLHEFGHGFGNLEDEYLNVIEPKEDDILSDNMDSLQFGYNCETSLEAATASWGLPESDIFGGCGGDCGPTCETFYRPYTNSIMNGQSEKCTIDGENTEICKLGPPFDPYYSVNEDRLRNYLEDYR